MRDFNYSVRMKKLVFCFFFGANKYEKKFGRGAEEHECFLTELISVICLFHLKMWTKQSNGL